MTSFVNNDVQSGNVIYAADHNEQGARIAAVLNGGIDSTNIGTRALALSNLNGGSTAGILATDSSGNISTSLPAGTIIQEVAYNFSAVATGTTIIPQDDTVPQSTEGTEFMSGKITPRFANSKLVIEMNAQLSCQYSGKNVIGAIFKDTEANALAVNFEYNDDGAGLIPTIVNVRHSMTSGTTSEITFKFRAGPHVADTITFNGINGVRVFGSTTKSSIVIKEIAQ